MKRLTTLWIVLLVIILLTPSITARAEQTTDAASDVSTQSKPQVIIDSYKVKQDTLTPGSESTLQINIKNTSKYSAVKDLILTYTSDDNNVYPVFGQSNQIYIESLASDTVKQVDIPIEISQTASETASLNFSLEYRGKGIQNYSNEVAIFLPIVGRGILEINKISLDKTISIEKRAILSVNYCNYGDDIIYNVKMHIAGNVEKDQQEIALNDVAAGAIVYQDYYLNLTKLGTQNLEVSFTFEDKEGHEYSIQGTTLETTVVPADENASQDVSFQEDNSGTQTFDLSIIYIIAGGAIAIILLIVGVVRLRKKK